MSTAFVFDFDGVFNAVVGRGNRPDTNIDGVFNNFHQVDVEVEQHGIKATYPITYAPVLVEWFNEISEQFDVYWLTTWREHTQKFPELFGLNASPWLQWNDTMTGWGKLNAMYTFVDEFDYDRVVWVDDHHTFFHIHTRPFREANPQVKIVAPLEHTGLRKPDLDQIEFFVNGS